MSHDTHDGLGVVSGSGHLATMDLPRRDAPQSRYVVRARVETHRHVADRYWFLRLYAPEIALAAEPGQFLMLTIARDDELGPVLPRPMAIYDVDATNGFVDVMYGVVGGGTRRLSTFAPGEHVTTVGPLGQGFVVPDHVGRILLLGRGIGTCSLTLLAAQTASRGLEVVAVDSARTGRALVADETYRRAGVTRLIQVTDADGTSEVGELSRRLVSDDDSTPPGAVFVCGSNRLTRLAVHLGERWGAEVQVSLEAHMACGLGYCHGCSSGQRSADAEAPLVCRDGPVFRWTSGQGVPA